MALSSASRLSSPITEAGSLLPLACLHHLQDRDDTAGPASGSLLLINACSVDAVGCCDSSLCPALLLVLALQALQASIWMISPSYMTHSTVLLLGCFSSESALIQDAISITTVRVKPDSCHLGQMTNILHLTMTKDSLNP